MKNNHSALVKLINQGSIKVCTVSHFKGAVKLNDKLNYGQLVFIKTSKFLFSHIVKLKLYTAHNYSSTKHIYCACTLSTVSTDCTCSDIAHVGLHCSYKLALCIH